MTLPLPSTPVAPALPDEGRCDPARAQPSADEARLAHLFRASMKSGRVHPLYRPILIWRQTRAAP